MEDINDNVKNLYIIKRRLGELKCHPGASCFHYYVGKFIVKIFTHRLREPGSFIQDDCITKHSEVDVNLYENQFAANKETIYETYIGLDQDSRFQNYQPIKYRQYGSDGNEMPIMVLCELIKYLHRLSNLTAFM